MCHTKLFRNILLTADGRKGYSTPVPSVLYTMDTEIEELERIVPQDSRPQFPDTGTMEKVKSAVKGWLKRTNRDYKWLADKMGKARSTIANYMARKPMPWEIVDEIRRVMQETADEAPKLRNRRTREQIRRDEEASIRAGQAAMAENGGYDDEDPEVRKWRLAGEKAKSESEERMDRGQLKVRLDDVLSADGVDYAEGAMAPRAGRLPGDVEAVPGVMDAPVHLRAFDAIPEQERVKVEPFGCTFTITLPDEFVQVYRREAKWIADHVTVENSHGLVARLIARAIVYDVRQITQSDTPYFEKLADREYERAVARGTV